MPETNINEQIKGEIIIYKAAEGPEVLVNFDNDDVWVTQADIANLFQTERSVITKHVGNIFKSAELSENSVCANFAHTAADGKTYKVKYYNLDVVISVGYRVNSKKATLFRKWATQKLKELMVKGYTVQAKTLKEQHNFQLKELQQTVKLFQNVLDQQRAEGYEKDLLNIITDYAGTWAILNKYDEGELRIEDVTKKTAKKIGHEEIGKIIEKFRARLVAKGQASGFFGQQSPGKLQAVLGSIFQTYEGKELYPSLEEKAAHLFYFLIKDHPFVDGNKRIASLVFLLFLVENRFLINRKGERKVNDSALAALALLVAESKPEQKDVMVKLVVNMINKK